ncbi:choice-of-anchor P family protein [Allobranchiibius sp. GilTou73]|uniref:choice-of-anchor P family protein n=1 Tax=Allobranchiibius sp. GilTou73 TaxID=2904523 RepID=UPI001F293DF4|nr:choice-of-anchor P family protein [Allobranchiibius sp. GilTou73]UIJ36298.1 hypothetical protein LVQ62_08010 [Allobranchiibius sp. GilTou73]
MRRASAVVVASTVLAGFTLSTHPPTASAAAATPAPVGYSAYGYGTYVSSSLAALNSGATGYSVISCTTTSNLTNSNQVASVDLGKVGKVGTDYSQSRSILDASGRTSQGIAQISGVNLLGGLITSTSLKTTSRATYTPSKTSYGSNSTAFVGIKVAGKGFASGVGPNTKVALALGGKPFASVVLNEQSQAKVNGLTQAVTTGIHVTVTNSNSMGLPIGTTVYIGRSYAALKGTPAGFATGSAYGTQATLSGSVKSGPTALAGVACDGGDRTVSVASSAIPSLLSLGAVKSTTSSVATPKLTSSATNQISGLNVLSSLIGARTITASTTTSRTSFTSAATFTDTSGFVGLKIAGMPSITDSVKPNTTITLSQLGTVTLHKVTKTATGIRVVMVSITLDKALGNLAKGTLVEIGVSNTGVQNR